VGVPEGRRGYESDFRLPLLPPVAGAPLPHSAGPLPRRKDTSHSVPELARYHNHPAAYSPRDRLYGDDGLEEYIDEPGLSGDNSVGLGPVMLWSWYRKKDWRRQEEETLSRLVTPRQRSFDEREKRKQLEKEEGKLRMEAEGGDYGTDETGREEEEEERKGQEEEEMGKMEEDGLKRNWQAEDTRQGFRDWDSCG